MHFGRYRIWIVGVVVVAIVALIIYFSGAWASHPLDIPCQDGTWDAAQQTCIPDPNLGAG
jgi:hypothetical protein